MFLITLYSIFAGIAVSTEDESKKSLDNTSQEQTLEVDNLEKSVHSENNLNIEQSENSVNTPLLHNENSVHNENSEVDKLETSEQSVLNLNNEHSVNTPLVHSENSVKTPIVNPSQVSHDVDVHSEQSEQSVHLSQLSLHLDEPTQKDLVEHSQVSINSEDKEVNIPQIKTPKSHDDSKSIKTPKEGEGLAVKNPDNIVKQPSTQNDDLLAELHDEEYTDENVLNLDNDEDHNSEDSEENNDSNSKIEILKITSNSNTSYTELQILVDYMENTMHVKKNGDESKFMLNDFEARKANLDQDTNNEVANLEKYINHKNPAQQQSIHDDIVTTLNNVSHLSETDGSHLSHSEKLFGPDDDSVPDFNNGLAVKNTLGGSQGQMNQNDRNLIDLQKNPFAKLDNNANGNSNSNNNDAGNALRNLISTLGAANNSKPQGQTNQKHKLKWQIAQDQKTKEAHDEKGLHLNPKFFKLSKIPQFGGSLMVEPKIESQTVDEKTGNKDVYIDFGEATEEKIFGKDGNKIKSTNIDISKLERLNRPGGRSRMII